MTTTDVEHLREQTVASHEIYKGRILRMHEDEVRLPSGRMGKREIVDHPGAVCVVATNDAGEVVLVRQWRHPLGRALWELPAGTLDPDEAPAKCAVRELAEETGYTAAQWTAITYAGVSPGYSSEIIHFYRATGLTEGDVHSDEDELLDVRFFSPAEIAQLIANRQTDIKTMGGLALAGISLNG